MWCRLIIDLIGLRVLDDKCNSSAHYTSLHGAARTRVLMVQILIAHTLEIQSQLLLNGIPWLARHQLGAV